MARVGDAWRLNLFPLFVLSLYVLQNYAYHYVAYIVVGWMNEACVWSMGGIILILVLLFIRIYNTLVQNYNNYFYLSRNIGKF